MLFRRLLNYLTDPITSDPDVGDVPIFDGSRFVAGPGGAPSWLLHTAGIPDNSQGSSGDYALGQDGVIYRKQAGTWGAYGGGGGSGTTGRQSFHDSPGFDPGATPISLAWVPDGASTDDLVDLTDPTNPFVKDAGVYAIQTWIRVSSLGTGEPGGYFTLIADQDNLGASPTDYEPVASGGGSTRFSPKVTSHFDAGSHLLLSLTVFGGIGAGGGGVQWWATIDRLS